MTVSAWILIAVGMAGLGLFLAVYPLVTWIASALRPERKRPAGASGLSVSMIVVVRNGEMLLGRKLDNALSQAAPEGGLEVVVHSDGSTDGTEAVAASYADKGVRLSATSEHMGKAHGLNAAAAMCTGDVLVLSDADAMLAPDALANLMAWFADAGVGGVCGRRVVPSEDGSFQSAQASYVGMDSRFKLWEHRLGTLTANDGKLYAVRRSLFPEIPGAVTDDFFAALSVVRAGSLFLFDPQAQAAVAVPSRSPKVELRRRRRIVARSLNAIAMNRELLHPGKYGLYAFRLAANKIARRLMPLFLLSLLAGSAMAAQTSVFAALILAGLCATFALAAATPLDLGGGRDKLAKLSGAAYYFYLGNLGMLLGIVDFLRGRRPDRWEPDKDETSLKSKENAS